MTSPQIVLITGANQGLGYFAALQLSKLPGFHVLVGSRDAAKGATAVKQIEAEGASFRLLGCFVLLKSRIGGPSPVSAITVDLASDPSIDAARAEIESRFGRLDVLVVRLYHPRPERHSHSQAEQCRDCDRP
jgi:NAD(P)-dependent dehydrogenase (short-subunit alcohol dehydrogenase family)